MHSYMMDDLDPRNERFAGLLPHVSGPGQLTDLYLLALAASHNAILATFDGGIGAGLAPSNALLGHLELIPG